MLIRFGSIRDLQHRSRRTRLGSRVLASLTTTPRTSRRRSSYTPQTTLPFRPPPTRSSQTPRPPVQAGEVACQRLPRHISSGNHDRLHPLRHISTPARLAQRLFSSPSLLYDLRIGEDEADDILTAVKRASAAVPLLGRSGSAASLPASGSGLDAVRAQILSAQAPSFSPLSPSPEAAAGSAINAIHAQSRSAAKLLTRTWH